MKRHIGLIFLLVGCSADAFTSLDGAVPHGDAEPIADGGSVEDHREEVVSPKEDGSFPDVISFDAGLDVAFDAPDASCPTGQSPEAAGKLSCGSLTCTSQNCCEYSTGTACGSCGSGDYWVWQCSSTEQCGAGKVCTANLSYTKLTGTCPLKLELNTGAQAAIMCNGTSWGHQFCASDVGCPAGRHCVQTDVSIFGGTMKKTTGICQL